MKSKLLFVVCLLFLSFYCFSAEFPFRTWTSSSGVRIQARLISKDGDKLTIERSDLKQFVFPLSLLSKDDQNYVRSVMDTKPSASRSTKPIPPSSLMAGNSGTLPIWSPTVIEKWWLTHADGDWNELSVKMMADLRSIWTTKEKRSLREGRDFFSWFDHWRWLTLFNKLDSVKGADQLKDIFVAVGKNAPLQKTFLKALHPNDQQVRALEIFLSIAHEHPDLIERYSALAVAYAVVFDQPF